MLVGAMGPLLVGGRELMLVGVWEPSFMGGKSLHPPGTACWEVGAGKGERDKKKSNKEFDKRKHHKTCNFFSDQSCHTIFGSVRNSLVGAVFVFVSN